MSTQRDVARRFWARCSAWDWLLAIRQRKGKYPSNTSWPMYTKMEFIPEGKEMVEKNKYMVIRRDC